jgi:hypothetical protein
VGKCSYADFAIQGNTLNRNNNAPLHGFTDSAGKGTRISRVWVEHTHCGYWVGSGDRPTDDLVITGVRVRNTYADGVNFCNGASNSVVQDSHFRNTGDDSVASWTPHGQGGVNTNNTVRDTTAQQPWRANCFAVYGGQGMTIEGCRAIDTAR